MPIVIDSREPKDYQAAALAMLDGDVAPLTYGDYTWDRADGKVVVVERKTVHDLLSSISDGRWAQQVRELVTADLPLLLLEGNLLMRQDGTLFADGERLEGWRLDGLDGILLTAQMHGLILVRCSQGPNAVARRLFSLHRQTTQQEHSSLIPRKRRLHVDGDEADAVALLSALPGCGPTTARKLLAHFGSVPNVLRAITKQEPLPTVIRVPRARAERWQHVVCYGENDEAESCISDSAS